MSTQTIRLTLTLISAFVLAACRAPSTQPMQRTNAITREARPAQLPSVSAQMTPDQIATLSTLRKVDDHPLYVMTHFGDYDRLAPLSEVAQDSQPGWACSLFVSFAGDEPIFGRNFDWQEAAALLLFTQPSDGYASVAMVDISYLGYDLQNLNELDTVEGRKRLLAAPRIPFDGMNEHGLAVGMAAVRNDPAPNDPNKPAIGSLRIIRMMLDKARNVDEAIALMQHYTINFSGGPNIHYLIADRSGHSAVAEVLNGKLEIVRNDQPWQVATNFLLADPADKAANQFDRRYDILDEALQSSRGRVAMKEALGLLERVAQNHTRWSMVYNLRSGETLVATSRRFDQPHTAQLPMK